MNDVDTIETLHVANLILTERSARDRGDWKAMRAAYDAESLVHLSWYRGPGPRFVEQSRQMHDDYAWDASHRLSPPLVTLGAAADKALAEVGVAIDMRRRLHDVEVDITSYGRLLYRARRASAGWLITHLTMIYVRDTLVPVGPAAIPSIDSSRLGRYRQSYRYLCYVVEQDGSEPHSDLPGTDRPELVTEAYESARTWLEANREHRDD